jgi:hypothetical protein
METENYTQRRRYSAATMAVAYDLIERLIVDITAAPSGTANAARDLQNSAGSATCSITLSKIPIANTLDMGSK